MNLYFPPGQILQFVHITEGEEGYMKVCICGFGVDDEESAELIACNSSKICKNVKKLNLQVQNPLILDLIQ